LEAVEAWSSSRGSGSGWWRSRAAGLQLPPPDFRSRRPPPLFPSLSIGAAGACGVPARAISPRFPPRAPRSCPFPRAPHSYNSLARASCLPLPTHLSPPFSRERTTSRSVWCATDTTATPFFMRRRHTPESRGGLDATIQKSPRRQDDAIKTMEGTFASNYALSFFCLEKFWPLNLVFENSREELAVKY